MFIFLFTCCHCDKLKEDIMPLHVALTLPNGVWTLLEGNKWRVYLMILMVGMELNGPILTAGSKKKR